MQTTQPVYSEFGRDPDLRAMVAEFVDHLPVRISQLEASAMAGDRLALESEARRLQGAGGCYGFSELAQRAETLRATCRADSPEAEIAAAVTEVLELCERIRPGEASIGEDASATRGS